MNAIVIQFSGKMPSKTQIESMIDACSFIDGQVSINTFNDETVSKLLIQSARAPKLSTEEGDNAVTVLAGILPIEDDSRFIVKLFEHLKDHNEAVTRACSILSQSYPISKTIAKKYGFTKDKIEAISELYRTWNNV